MTTSQAMPEQGHVSPAYHQKPPQRLSVWHYRRNGTYYLRVRPRGCSARSLTVSLRTSERPSAMTLSQDILKALAVFHLDRPEATRSDLKERFAEVAHGLLMQAYSDSDLSIYDEIYSDLAQSLMEAAATASLSLDQHRALDVSREIVKGAQARLEGNPRSLMDTIERLEEPESVKPGSLSVYASSSRSDPTSRH